MMRILISAGELSGSMHIAEWVKRWRAKDDTVQFYGMGGDAMARAGVNLLINSERDLSVIGLSGALRKWRKFLKARRTMIQTLTQDRPDWLILVDYAGFNLSLARRAKKLGIKVCYYIPPKVWAWRSSRIKQLRECVDLLAVILPFEVEYYAKYHLRAYYVGNPSWRTIEPLVEAQERNRAQESFDGIRKIGLLPGSRRREIEELLPVMLDAAQKLQQTSAYKLRFYLLPARSVAMKTLRSIISRYPKVQVEFLACDDLKSLQQCQAAVVASGTATLEVALLGVPMVAIYRLQWWEYWIARWFIKLPYVTLCNIVATAPVIVELLQGECRADRVAAELRRLLDDEACAKEQKLAYKKMRTLLASSAKCDLVRLITEYRGDGVQI